MIVNWNSLRHAGDPGESGPTWRDAVDGAPLALVALAVVHAAYLHGVGQGGVHARQGGVHAPHGAGRRILRLHHAKEDQREMTQEAAQFHRYVGNTNASSPEMT